MPFRPQPPSSRARTSPEEDAHKRSRGVATARDGPLAPSFRSRSVCPRGERGRAAGGAGLAAPSGRAREERHGGSGGSVSVLGAHRELVRDALLGLDGVLLHRRRRRLGCGRLGGRLGGRLFGRRLGGRRQLGRRLRSALRPRRRGGGRSGGTRGSRGGGLLLHREGDGRQQQEDDDNTIAICEATKRCTGSMRQREQRRARRRNVRAARWHGAARRGRARCSWRVQRGSESGSIDMAVGRVEKRRSIEAPSSAPQCPTQAGEKIKNESKRVSTGALAVCGAAGGSASLRL